MALRVTLRRASCILYRNASTCFISNWYSLILLPRAACSFSILVNTISSRPVLGTHPTTLFFPHCSLGTTNDNVMPVRPARAVRPTRCVYERADVGKSKFNTQATSIKSTPRVTPYSLSLFTLRCECFRPYAQVHQLQILRLPPHRYAELE